MQRTARNNTSKPELAPRNSIRPDELHYTPEYFKTLNYSFQGKANLDWSMVKHKIKGVTRPFAVTVCMLVSFVLAGQPAQATVGPGWNNLWVRAACLSKTPNPADVVTSFNVWVPNSPQGDKAFN